MREVFGAPQETREIGDEEELVTLTQEETKVSKKRKKPLQVWTLFRGKAEDALKDIEWLAMAGLILKNNKKAVVIQIREKKSK